VAARTLPHLHPCDRHGVRFQRAARIAFLGPRIAGTLIVHFGGYGPAACIVALIYILGVCAVWFLPETAGKPLPEKV
jgi:hypothetical protein